MQTHRRFYGRMQPISELNFHHWMKKETEDNEYIPNVAYYDYEYESDIDSDDTDEEV